jgi:hypothetical protein
MMTGEWKNSVDYKPVVYDLAEDLLFFSFCYPAFVLYGLRLEPGIGAYLRPFLLLAALLLMTAVRRKTKKVYAFAGGLIAIAAVFVLLPFGAATRSLFTLFVLAAAGVSVKKVRDSVKRAQLKYDPTVRVGGSLFAGVGMFAGGVAALYFTYMVSIGMRAPQLLLFCLVALGVFLACFSIYIHKTGTYSLIEWKKENGHALGKIKSFNLLFALVSTAAVAVTGFFSYNIVYWTGLYRIDDSIIGSLLHMPQVRKAPSAEQNSGSGSSTSYYMNFMKNHHYKPTLLTEILNKILVVLAWVAICICLLIVATLLIRVIFNFIRNLRGSINEETRTVFSFREAAGEAAEKLKKSTVVSLFTGNTNRIKIRRLYYRAVRGYRTRGVAVSGSDSPAEIRDKIREKAGRDLSGATHLYEKARYARNDCTREELAQFKTELHHSRD